MLKYILQRISTSLVTLLVVITLTFFLMRAIPGGPFTDEKVIPQPILEKILDRYHMNDPLWKQYGNYLWNAIHFDFGPSYRYEGMTVNQLIANSFPISALIGTFAIILSLLIGIPTGIISALRRGHYQDKLAILFATLGITIPNYVIATLLVYFFAYRWGLVTVGFWEGLPTSILPAC